MKRRITLSILLGTAVFGAVFASAATLGGINTGKLGADDAAIVSCDTDGVVANYTTAYNTTGTAGYKVNTVKVTGVNNACDGQTISVTLTGAGNSSLQEVTMTVPTDAAATEATLSFGSSTLAENVTGVHVVISGTAV